MTRTTVPLAALAVALVCASHAAPALAQRVFVAAQGSDANPCTFALPCRTFQHAHDVVAAGGEIDVLDPAGYGKFTISKSISIQGHGFSGISVTAGNAGITINAGPTDAVHLNGLLIEGSGVGAFGIELDSGGSLVVENCVIHGMTNNGIVFLSFAATLQTLSVFDSYVAHSGLAIIIQTSSSGAIRAAVDRSALYGNASGGLNVVGGVSGTGALNVAVTDSVSSNSAAGAGFSVGSATSVASLVLTRVTAAGNSFGVAATDTHATLRLTQSTVTANATGYLTSIGGTIFSYGDNTIDDNGSNSGTLTAASKQ
jgi:hypothetical protein